MYKYGIKKNLKSKYASDKNESSKNNYLKMYNLELETMNSNSIAQLQNRIGNSATEELLNELSMTTIDGNDKKGSLAVKKGMPYNNSTEANSMLNSNLRDLSKSQSNNLNDVLSRTMLFDENKQIGRLKLKSENIHWILGRLNELSLLLKIKDSKDEDKSLQIKNADKMLNKVEKTTISDAEYIIELIKNLPTYNEDKATIEEYMKTLNLILNTGINIIEFLKLNGHIDIQKKMLYKALGAERAGR